mmetsp:Transcript_19437/g.58700  ORF Transcript_19437/g.58700 Transcript_19437/m.58700 type:complete len:102 (+) Transcript_19437:513-818(+)
MQYTPWCNAVPTASRGDAQNMCMRQGRHTRQDSAMAVSHQEKKTRPLRPAQPIGTGRRFSCFYIRLSKSSASDCEDVFGGLSTRMGCVGLRYSIPADCMYA